jgi:DNA-binding SARP family transcriptional activator
MDVRVLGPMEVLRNGESLALGGPRQRTLLALLVARLPKSVDTDTLIDELWGEGASPGAKSTLQSLVSNLRQVLGDVIPFERGSYRLDLEPESVDAIRFARVIEEARPELAISPSATAERLREALGWWRGRPLADLVDSPAIRVYVRSLEESRLEAVELRLDAELAAGLHASLVAELEALAEEHPFREHLRAQHMLALYRSGRQGEALRAYRKTEAILAEELGVDPSPELQDLELSILSQDDSLLAGRVGSITQRLAVLVGDMEGSAEKWESDPSAMAEEMALYDRIVREAVEGGGGRMAGRPGPGLLAAFSDTASATSAAESILRGHQATDRETMMEVRLRFGIDVGEVETSGGTFVGPPVSRATSLCAAAHGGQVLISGAAQVDLVASAPAGVQLRQLGEHRLRGMAAAERVAQLVVSGLPSDFPELGTEDPVALAAKYDPLSLPGYEVRELLSDRDHDELWRAYQPSVGREVAIRILSGELASDPAFIRKFEAVARTVARLTHPHVVPLIDFWRGTESAYLVMGLVPSGTLGDLMRTGEINPETSIAILQQVCSALDHAHSLGITHGGVSADSILLDDKGNAYLADLALTSSTSQSGGRVSRAADFAGLRDLARGLLGESPGSDAAISRFEPEDGTSSAVGFVSLVASALVDQRHQP